MAERHAAAPVSRNDLSKCVFVDGVFEPNEFSFLAKFLEPGMTFVDVGANEGVYTVFASRCVGQAGRVVAIEPSSREFDRLRGRWDEILERAASSGSTS